MRGRKPELRVVDGSFHAAAGALDAPPPGMGENQAEVWRHLVESAPRGHLRATDAVLLAMAADAIVAYEDAVTTARRAGILIKGERGPVLNPGWRAAMRFSAHAMRLLETLALTPGTAARTERRP